jgi:hypothetical protein
MVKREGVRAMNTGPPLRVREAYPVCIMCATAQKVRYFLRKRILFSLTFLP